MAIRDRFSLKKFFRKGSMPTEQQFADLIDSSINRKDDGLLINKDQNGNIQAEIQGNLSVEADCTLNGDVAISGDLIVDGDVLLADTGPEALASVLSLPLSGTGQLPKGSIVLWYGEQIPDGWVECDGNNNHPNPTKLAQATERFPDDIRFICRV